MPTPADESGTPAGGRQRADPAWISLYVSHGVRAWTGDAEVRGEPFEVEAPPAPPVRGSADGADCGNLRVASSFWP